MKKLFASLLALAVIAALGIGLWSIIAPLVKDEVIGAISDLFTSTEAPTDSRPEGDVIEIPVRVYYQDPESGEYRLERETTEYIREGTYKEYDFDAVTHYAINTEKSNFRAEKAGDAVEVYYDCETCKVVFDIGEATLTDGYAIQTLRKGQTPKAPTLSLPGYTLTGYDKTLDKVYADTTYTPHWEVANYVLRLHATNRTDLGSDRFTQSEIADSCFETTYTFRDSLTVPTPKSPGYTFLEWNTSPDGKGETVTKIAEGTTADTTLYAIYTVKLYTITFVSLDGDSFPAYYLPYDTVISAPAIAPENQKPGMGLSWYTDNACTKLYDFRKMPDENITLYGKWKEDTGVGFLNWDRNDIAANTIDSLSELVDYIDYIRFHNITEALRVEVTYTDYESLKKDVSTAEILGEYRANGSISYTTGTGNFNHANAKCYISMRVNNSFRDKEAKKTAPSNHNEAYELLTQKITPRGSDYAVFYIDKLTYTYPVTTTNQLQYVVEHGYRPIPEKGSPAEKVWLQARALLNEILPSEASDFEKAELIFNYLILNIEYDDAAVEIAQSSPSTWPEYDAYYLEGVFNNKKAVCDGIAKAFSLLCNIEGIPAVEVVGTGHAWNRVKIDNRWYVVDATFGNLHISGSDRSIADHSQFLISDAEKTNAGYAPHNYKEIKAEKNYGYYDTKTFEGGNSYFPQTYDYVIDSITEFKYFLRYLKLELKWDLTGTTVNFIYNIPDTFFDVSFKQALRAIESNGFVIDNQVAYYGNGVGSVYKLVFK